MLQLITLNQDGTFDVSYSDNDQIIKRKQTFVELKVTSMVQRQLDFDPDHINSPYVMSQIQKNDKTTNFSPDIMIKEDFGQDYGLFPMNSESPQKLTSREDSFQQSSRKITTLYEDWINPDENIQRSPKNGLNRLHLVKKSQVGERKENVTQYTFSVNLTQLMLAQMNVSKRLLILLIFNMIIDTILRLSFILFVVIAAFYKRQYLKTLLIFLYLPRILHIFTITKLLFLNKYNPENRPILNLSHLVRSNFIEEDAFVDEDIHPLKRESVLKVIITRTILFLLLPVEICILVLPLRTSCQRRRSLKTYILMTYVLKGIEAIMFQPVLLFLMTTGFYSFDKVAAHHSELYRRITLLLVIADITKYILLSTYLLCRGNMHKKAQSLRLLKAFHQQAQK